MKEKTTDQLRAIFGLGKQRGLEKPDLEELAAEKSNGRIDRLSLLSFDEANQMITHLGGEAFPASGSPTVPKRTENYRKQKAGISTIETDKQLKAIKDMARQRNMTEQGITSLAKRMNLPWPPITTAQANKIFEALKSMNKRDEVRRAA